MMKKILLPTLFVFFSVFTYGQTVVDLTGINEDVLSDTISGLEGEPMEIILNPDVAYSIGSRRINQTTIIRANHDGPMAEITIGNNFWLGEVTIDSIIFDNVYLKGGGYVFNNGNDFSVGKVAFLNSKLEKQGGLWRGKAASGNVGEFLIDNCVIDSIGEYTLFRPQGANFTDKFTLRNSTINYAMGVVRASEKINTVTIENVTIHQACDAEFWINAMFTFMDGFDNLTFTNVLVGPGLNGDVGGVEDGAATPGNITVTNSYYTSDFTQVEGLELPGDFGAYAGTAADLWTDPASADFTIVDNDFDAKFSTGDPRWIPAQLSELSISVGELTPAFDPTVLNYTSELPTGTEAVVVTAGATHEGATVSGDGVIDVSSGTGTANIQVLEGTISQTYTIEFTVVVGLEEGLQDRVKLFYNAINDEIVVESPVARDQLQLVEIFDLTGQLLRTQVITQPESRMTFSTNDLDRGMMYLLRGTTTNRESVYLKFVK